MFTLWNVKISLTEECEKWLLNLTEKERVDVFSVIKLFEKLGPHLGFPYSSKVNGSKRSHMRELRMQHLVEVSNHD